MFFSIKNKIDNEFDATYSLGNNFYLNIDSGWTIKKYADCVIYFKGYSDSYAMEELLQKIYTDSNINQDGNFTAVVNRSDEVILKTDNCRAYPLYISFGNDLQISNLYSKDKKIEFDHSVRLSKKDRQIILNDVSKFPKHDRANTIEEAVHYIDKILSSNIKNFLANNKNPIKIFLTGGIDSMLIYSYIKKFTKEYKLLEYEFRKWTKFSKNNWQKIIQTSESYRQSHSWGDESVVLVNGFYGDQFFFRDAACLNLICEHYKKKLSEQTQKYNNSYNSDYFNLKSTMEFVENISSQKKYKIIQKDINKTKEYCINMLASSYFVWHLDHTIYYTPFKNLKIPNIILDLPIDAIIDNAFNCTIQKKLLQNNDDKLLSIVYKKKNAGDYQNLLDYIKKL